MLNIPERTVGVDLGDRFSYLFVIDQEGNVVMEGRIGTRSAEIQEFFGKGSGWRVAMEAGTHSGWVSRLIQRLGHEVIVANGRRVRLISHSGRKDDRVDAESLARLARLDIELLHGIEHRGEEAQADLVLLRSRQVLVRQRSALVNHCRGTLKSLGQRLVGCTVENFHRKAPDQIPESVSKVLQAVVGQIAGLSGQIREMDKQVTRLCEEKYPQTNSLRQVRGVGPLTALCYVLTVEDPHRFEKSRQVGAFVGLVPGRRQSGDYEMQRRISKTGDRMLRWLLVQCAHYILGHFGEECDLRRFGLRIGERGGARSKKIAVVAVARKLSVLLHKLWVSGQEYDPFFNAREDRQAVA